MIEITNRTIGLWYMRMTANQDWLCGASLTEDHRIEVLYRFRYYRDDKHFEESDDERNWYQWTMTEGDSTRAVELIRELAGKLVERGALGPLYEELMNEGGVDDLLDRWSRKPFTKVRVEQRH